MSLLDITINYSQPLTQQLIDMVPDLYSQLDKCSILTALLFELNSSFSTWYGSTALYPQFKAKRLIGQKSMLEALMKPTMAFIL